MIATLSEYWPWLVASYVLGVLTVALPQLRRGRWEALDAPECASAGVSGPLVCQAKPGRQGLVVIARVRWRPAVRCYRCDCRWVRTWLANRFGRWMRHDMAVEEHRQRYGDPPSNAA